VSIWAALAGGFVGTLVLTTTLRAASELRLTRIDLPFLLGTAFVTDRRRAKLLGYLIHFFFGFSFAIGYLLIFDAIGRAGWLLGALLGLLHGAFAGSVLVNVTLPLVHPRMGDPTTGADREALLEPPGFLMLSYGRSTPLVTLAAHVAYGAIVGGFVAIAR
jgi:hypothetical protein